MSKVTNLLELSNSDMYDMLSEQATVIGEAMKRMSAIQDIIIAATPQTQDNTVKDQYRRILNQVSEFLVFKENVSVQDEIDHTDMQNSIMAHVIIDTEKAA